MVSATPCRHFNRFQGRRAPTDTDKRRRARFLGKRYNTGIMAVQIVREGPIAVRDAIIPYTVAGINMLAATLAGAELLAPRTLLVAITLIAAGIPSSIFLARRGVNRILLNLVTMAPLLLLTWSLIQGMPGMSIDWSSPWESFIGTEVSDNLSLLLHILVIIAAGRAFSLVTQRDLLQTPIPSASIFLLAAIIPMRMSSSDRGPFTLGLSLLPIVCLFVLGATSLFLLSQAHSRGWFAAPIPPRIQRRQIVWVLLVSAAVFPLALVIGNGLRAFNLARLAAYHAGHPLNWAHWNRSRFQRFAIGLSESVEMSGEGEWPSSDQVIMEVEVKRGANYLWRSTTYDRYAGRAWTARAHAYRPLFPGVDAMLPQTTLAIPMDPAQSDPGILEALAEGKLHLDARAEKNDLLDQRFRVRVDSTSDPLPLYGVFQISRLTLHAPGRRIAVSVDRDGGLFAAKATFAGIAQLYQIQSVVKPSPSALKLEKAVRLAPEDERSCLGMPYDIRPIFRRKAQDILQARGMTPRSDPLAIVHEFETYLGKHYRYTLKPRPPKSPDVDPLVDFLLTQKRGYCTYFSGALVMLCRSVDIPARLAVGFNTGETAAERAPGDNQRFIVRARDSHAWAEVFLPRYGWYTSDPTSGSIAEPDVWSSTWDFVTAMGEVLKSGLARAIAFFSLTRRLWAYAGLGVALLLLLAAGLIIWRRERPPRFPRRPLSPEEAATQVLLAYRQMLRWFHRWDVIKPDGLTAQEFAGRLCRLNPVIGGTAGELCALYLRARYSPDPIEDADARRAIALLQQLWEQWREERGRLAPAGQADQEPV